MAEGPARTTPEMPMTPVRVLACGLALLLGGTAHATRLLDDAELSQVHAAGLPDPAQPMTPHSSRPGSRHCRSKARRWSASSRWRNTGWPRVPHKPASA